MKEIQKQEKKEDQERIVRILSQDIKGSMDVYSGLTKIKGISWSMSNAICNSLGIDKKRKISSLTEDEIKKISDFVKNPQLPKFLVNRPFDFSTGKDLHLIGSSLDLQTEFDIKRLKKIKSYRGIRHAMGQPVRGQRTKSHFRKNKIKGVGLKKKKK
ncbi:MAG: 30S ribosomal protein S13 [Candidatus Pacearchaeota archaeon]|nr:MAG: 30S ribosomal protein S13 [Candidatus Pacearchaeota archaeon]